MSEPSRLEKKALHCLDTAEYYEAHQVYRTMYFRMILKGQFDELLDLLYSGSQKFIEVNDALAAIDLAELYADTLLKASSEPSEKIFEQIFSMVERFSNPSFPSPSPDAQNRSRSIATKRRERKYGLSKLHHIIAQAYCTHRQFVNARNHMLFAEQPEEFAKLLHTLRLNGGCKFSEFDMFCVLPCLQLLTMHRVRTASQLLKAYLTDYDKSSCNGIRQELFNFIRILCGALTLRDAKLFEHLINVYKPHLNVDPSYHNYLGQIGHIFFGIPLSKNKSDSLGGLLGNILKGVLGEKKDEEEHFSESDFESVAPNSVQPETEEAYETAEESEGPDTMTHAKQESRQSTIGNFDDLD
ncbi:hypothetical protein DICVIV_03143 [Dictyocaulus viviparus]|uniref:Golgi to ER traffic protein 4 homolog n=1 Tax=Dictyocaulus viviparus TaxID=29172 RepID=A0A0D8Y1J7_DICVI|nr:hypothetical protein DICVIV_03143 [Dictyocaulus viviparus]